MNEELVVLSNKTVKYLNDATIVSHLAHWNVRGPNFYEAHLMFDRVYGDLVDLMDSLVETLRTCGFSPDFNLFSGPGINMDFFDANSLVELVTDYVMALNSSIALFSAFCNKNIQDPRIVGINNHLQGMAQTVTNDLYLLQAWAGH